MCHGTLAWTVLEYAKCNNKVDKINILQRNSLILNRNIKKRIDKESISADYLFTI